MDDRFVCPICLDVVAATRVAACGHLYCAGCYYEMLAHSRVAACAVCRRRLGARAYPSYEVDSLLADETSDPLFHARVAASKERARESEGRRHDVGADGVFGIVNGMSSPDAATRTAALSGLLSTLEESHRWTCAALGSAALRAVARCAGECAETEEELAAAWRVLAHAATHFNDAGRFIGFGVHLSAAESMLSPLSSACSRRAASRAVDAWVPFHPAFFAFMLEPEWMERLLAVAPAAVASVALHAPGGMERLAEAGVLGTLLPQLAVHGRVLARDFLNAALAKPACAAHLRQAAAIMLVRPLAHAAAIAEIVWRDADAAVVIATARADDVLAAVQAARASEDFDAQLAVLELLHALHEKSRVHSEELVREVCAWMRSPDALDSVVSFSKSYVGNCARECVRCALAVSAACGRLDGGAMSEDTMFMVGDACLHEAVVSQRSGELAKVLGQMTFESYAEVYLALSLANTPIGAALVTDHALPTLHARLASMDEATATAALEAIALCAPRSLARGGDATPGVHVYSGYPSRMQV